MGYCHSFHNFFVPNIRRYLSKKNLLFKALLLTDNTLGHFQDFQHANVQVVFLPRNTSLLQQLDQGIMSTFKALYIKRIFRYKLEQMENDRFLSIVDAWKVFTVLDCVKHVGVSYTERLNACWKKVRPNVVKGQNSK